MHFLHIIRETNKLTEKQAKVTSKSQTTFLHKKKKTGKLNEKSVHTLNDLEQVGTQSKKKNTHTHTNTHVFLAKSATGSITRFTFTCIGSIPYRKVL